MLDDWLDVFALDLPPALIGPTELSAVRTAVSACAGEMVDELILETRLGPARRGCDLALRARNPAATRELVAGATHPVWRRIHALGDEWARPGSPLDGKISDVWFELDLDGASVPPPSLFLGATGGLRGPADWLTGYALPLLLATTDGDPRLGHLTRCLVLLSPRSRVFHVGAMLARDGAPLRLCIRGMAPDEAVEYLARIEWPGSASRAAGDLTAAAQLGPFALAIDVDSTGIGPTLGIECYAETNLALDWLVARRLCTPEERDALIGYRGFRARRSASSWPSSLTRAAALLEGRSESALFHCLNHIKLVLRGDGSVEAKAYLRVWHRWLGRTEIL